MKLELETIAALDRQLKAEGYRYRAQLGEAILGRYAKSAALAGAPTRLVESMRFDSAGADAGGDLARRLMLDFLDQLVGHHMSDFWGPMLAAQIEFRSRLGGMIAHRDSTKAWHEDLAERNFRQAIECMFHPYGIGCKEPHDAGMTSGRAVAAYTATLFRSAWASWFFYQGLVAVENRAVSSHVRATGDERDAEDPLRTRIRAIPYHMPQRMDQEKFGWRIRDWLRHQFRDPSDPAAS